MWMVNLGGGPNVWARLNAVNGHGENETLHNSPEKLAFILRLGWVLSQDARR